MSEKVEATTGRSPAEIGSGADLTLQVSVEEANLILEGLGGIAFARVFELVGKIQAQARAQVSQNGASRLPAED